MSDKSVPWSDVSDLEKERDALKAQLAEVTRERDELKKALAGWGQDAQEVRTILAAEQIKAERYREALKLVEKETIEMGIHGLTIYVQHALSEAEGE